MTDQPQPLFAAVDALLAAVDDGGVLPVPDERVRLREAAGLTQAAVAQALGVRVASIQAWETGRAEPKAERIEAYRRLLEGLSRRFPASAVPPGSSEAAPRPDPGAPSPSAPAAPPSVLAAVPSASAAAPTAPPRPAAPGRQPAARRADGKQSAACLRTAAAGGTDPRFENGPLAVVDVEDGQVRAYCTGGLVLDVPAKSLAALVDWTLAEAKLGQPKLSGPGKDADPLLVLTEAALDRYGLPTTLTDEERLAGRIPEGHKAVKQLARAHWKLTKRGFGPWARIYRPATGSERACVQLCIPSWHALDTRHWGHAGQLPPAELARVLGVYASRVMTPRGSTAVTGLELMTALHPPTRASQPDAAGRRHSERNPGSLGQDPVDCAPCEAPDGHPLLAALPRFHVRGPAEKLFEEAYDWARPMTDDECMLRYLVGIDVNMAFAAGANGLTVGLGAPTRVERPAFDAKLPGSWLVDLSHVDLSRVKVGKEWAELDASLLPSPFTPKGERPEGPAWYATPTVAYAKELGYEVRPVEAWVRYENGRYLDGWYQRLRDAYLATMSDLGVDADRTPDDFLAAMDGYRSRDPELAIVVSAMKATVKGGLGKLRERPRGEGWKPGQPWRALSRPTWRPDIRAAVISRTRINLHRKIVKHAAFTGQYPIAILSDCVVYAAAGPSPLDFLPYRDGKPLPGGFKLGVNPGLVKHEGTQSVLWGEEVRERFDAPELNLARYIKDGTVTDADSGE
ncbi:MULTISPECIES: telomere-associated protein Tap [Streptomyces]|uniref:Transcriptional regulatory protein n=3 Tax=Streptomyces TaxID=1883 RepID=Q9AJZ5_STRCO|nr:MULTISPECIES: helix-turn-helix transcriptional regulator [Streptomyces]AAO73842.1 telomere-binding protein TapL [Streptomyces lividans]AAO73843.1 telomere-binding protein TapC [Streptomyces coelicolor]MDX2924205.1 helix-turn-helix transcriptional regulator [Streptomyces sp. NRRL_B-16638]MDX3371667.1 helix-turn-helix transcriptional regulator [Streptomyces sp. ME02-6987-2C]MDX3406377.1 helix-turn-helix transcriptional regulator [Streptomyces sp. ME02-6977A]